LKSEAEIGRMSEKDKMTKDKNMEISQTSLVPLTGNF